MAEQFLPNWLQEIADFDLAGIAASPRATLLESLIQNAEKSLPSLGATSQMLRNALASTRSQQALLRRGALPLQKHMISPEAALTVLALAEKQLEELGTFAEVLNKRQYSFLANIDFVTLVNEKIAQEWPVKKAVEETLRSIREQIESSSARADAIALALDAAGMSAGERSLEAIAQALEEAGISAEERSLDAIAQALEEAAGVPARSLEQGPRTSKGEGGALIADDEFWTLVKEVALTELRARLDSPEDHTAYIRARINPVLNDIQP